MNILLLTRFYPPDIDGVGDHSFQLKKNIETQRPSTQVFLAISENKERNPDLKNVYLFKHWNKQEFLGLRTFIKLNQITSIIVQYVPYSFNKYGVPLKFLFLLKNAVPINVDLNFIIHESRIRIIPWQKYAVIGIGQALALKIIYSIATRIITSTPLYSELVHKQDPQKKIHIIPVGSNINSGEPAVGPLTSRSIDCFNICSFGQSFTSATAILQAIKTSSKTIPNLRMTFIGNIRADERKAIIEHAEALGIADAVRITGKLSKVEIGRILQDSDMYIMREGPCVNQWPGTSLRNGTLAAAFEAGLPVVGYLGPITNRELVDLRCITLLQKYNTTEIAKGILNYFRLPPKEKADLKQLARDFFEKNLTWDRITEAYAKLIMTSYGDLSR